jgi:hypothetical protein
MLPLQQARHSSILFSTLLIILILLELRFDLHVIPYEFIPFGPVSKQGPSHLKSAHIRSMYDGSGTWPRLD